MTYFVLSGIQEFHEIKYCLCFFSLQSMLQVAKNLFTHLGRLHDDIITWSRSPPSWNPFDGRLDMNNFSVPIDNLNIGTDTGNYKSQSGNDLLRESYDWPVVVTNQIGEQEAIADRVTGQSTSRGRLSGHIRPAPYPAKSTAEDKQRRRAMRLSPPPRHVLQQLQQHKKKLWKEEPPAELSSAEVLSNLERDTINALEQLGHSGYSPASQGGLDEYVDDVTPGSLICDLAFQQSLSGASLEYFDASDVWDERFFTRQQMQSFREANDNADTRLLRASLEKLNEGCLVDVDSTEPLPSGIQTTSSNEEVQHVYFRKESSYPDITSTHNNEGQDSAAGIPPTSILIHHKEVERNVSPTSSPERGMCSSSSTHQQTVKVDSQSGDGLPRRHNSVLELDWSPGTLSVHCIDQLPSVWLHETCMYPLMLLTSRVDSCLYQLFVDS